MLPLQLCIINASLTSTDHRVCHPYPIEFCTFHFYSLEIGCDRNNGDCVAACIIRVVFARDTSFIKRYIAKKGRFVRGIAIAHVLEITNDDI